MANPARDLRNRAQARWSGASVIARYRNGIVHQHPSDPNRRMVDASVGPLHIAGTETEIDTAWVTGISPWDLEMTSADYNVRAKSAFNGAPLLRYSNPAQTEWVDLQPRQLDWHNDRGDVQVAGSVQAVAATVNDDVLRWTNAYGAGRHFEYEAQTTRLAKKVILDSYASLPAPSTQILTGGNPVLRSQFQFAWSSSLSVFVDGAQWTGGGGSPTLTTANAIEFRRSDGTVAFVFRSPQAYDEDSTQAALLRVSRSGPNVLIEIRVSQSWLEGASGRIVIDPTVDAQAGASGDDAHQNGTSVFVNAPNTWCRTSNSQWLAARAAITGPASGDTVDVAYVEWGINNGGRDDAYGNLMCEDVDSAAEFVGDTNGISSRAKTSTVAWAASNTGPNADDWATSPSMVTPVQAVIDRAGWSSGNYMAWFFNATDVGGTCTFQVWQWDGNTSLASRIHIEYTAGGGLSATVNQVTETDTAQALARSKQKAAGQNTETDLAQSITPARAYAVAQASETDEAQAVSSHKTKILGQAEETDTAQAITPIRVYAVGQVTETDEAFQVSGAKSQVVGQVTETDLAQAVTSAKAKVMGQVSETDLAQSLGTTLTAEVGQVTETDEAQAVSSHKTKILGQASESDSAQTVTPTRAYAVGQVTETDEAQVVTSAKAKALGQATETDSALAFGTTITEQVGQAIETDSAQGITPQRSYNVGIAVEADSVFTMSSLKTRDVGQASETDLAQTISSVVGVGKSVKKIYTSDARATHVSSRRGTNKSEKREVDVL